MNTYKATRRLFFVNSSGCRLHLMNTYMFNLHFSCLNSVSTAPLLTPKIPVSMAFVVRAVSKFTT